MPWIKTIGLADASGDLKDVYDQVVSDRGKLSNIMKIQSLNPGAMRAHMDFYLSIMFRSNTLKREEKEMIAIVVSVVNKCDYCINHHAEALNFYWKDEKRLKTLIEDFRNCDISTRMKKILEYAVKLTETPQSIQESDIEELKKEELNDNQILDINLITSYFNFVNRIANGLGVEFSLEEVRGYKY